METNSENGQDLLLWFDALAMTPAYNKLQLHIKNNIFKISKTC